VLQNLMAVVDSAGHCFFSMRGLTIDQIPEMNAALLTAITGVPYDLEAMYLAGERIWNLEKLFNIRAGFTKADDTLPPRMLEEPLPDGPAKGHVHELSKMLPEYYKIRGWNENGIPSSEKLEELGLGHNKAEE
jgi:aldehyde:ferredoxin oxidoreductase